MNRSPQIDVEITKTGPGFPQSGKTTRRTVSLGQGDIRLACRNKECNSRIFPIDISHTIESMIAAGETQKERTEHCRGSEPSRVPGSSARPCGTIYHLKITIQP